jgi:hypothetical protein
MSMAGRTSCSPIPWRQLGFEGEQRLVFVMVCPTSKVLPAELLAQAERR